jgi:prepilin-type N-terminal cleavage/methylation domain-containing protein/prepilin-type processing-associated H-X9-DG protein
MSPALRRGLSLTEVLVSVGIIGLLLAILVPAVQHLRETARRTECFHHLSQFGKAIANFESHTKRLPPGTGTRFRNSLEDDGSPHVHLLPHLELKATYELLREWGGPGSVFDPRQIYWYPESFHNIAVFLCPSDGGELGTNYRFNTGPDVLPLFQKSYGRDSGPIHLLPSRTMAEITDGTSHTAVVSESLKGTPDRGVFHPAADIWMGGFHFVDSAMLTNEFLLNLCGQAADHPAPYFPLAGWIWPVYDLSQSLYNHVVGPNSATINCGDIQKRINSHPPPDVSYQMWNRGIQKASSWHPGGVNLLMLDGSVRFVSESIDLGVWRAISTHAGGEQVAGF